MLKSFASTRFRLARTGLCMASLLGLAAHEAIAEDAAAIDSRLSGNVKYLSSDELEGRGVGTKGLDQAADFIARQFRESGRALGKGDSR